MVTVCQPTPGYGYHSYGHNYCKEVAQETCYNTPVVTPTEPAVTVAYQSRSVSTSPSTSPSSPAPMLFLRPALPSPKSKRTSLLLRSASPLSPPPPAPLWSLPSPSRSARRSTTEWSLRPTMWSPMSLRPLLLITLRCCLLVFPIISKHSNQKLFI